LFQDHHALETEAGKMVRSGGPGESGTDDDAGFQWGAPQGQDAVPFKRTESGDPFGVLAKQRTCTERAARHADRLLFQSGGRQAPDRYIDAGSPVKAPFSFLKECPEANPNTKSTSEIAPSAKIVSPKTRVHFIVCIIGE
jgi:hypothetical protein